jgi:L-iditol 2-dehydrogenase
LKAAVYKDVNKVSLEAIEEPKLSDSNWVKVQVRACGLCGSDIHKILYQKPPNNYLKTTVLGHEITGDIIEIGSEVNNLQIGDRVAIEPIICCGNCEHCKKGKSQLCDNLKVIGRNYCGGFTERILVPSNNAWKLPDNVSYTDGTQIDLIAVAVHAVNTCKPVSDDWTCAVIGDGSLGLIMAQVARENGAKSVTIFSKHEFKQRIAIELNLNAVSVSDSEKFRNNFDVVFEAVGGKQEETLNTAIDITTPSGRIGVLGVYDFGYTPKLQARSAFYKEVSIIGLNSYSQSDFNSDFETAIKLLEEKKVNVQKIITHTFNLDQFNTALNLVKSKAEAVKIVFQNQ